jgi:hypothetical protein
MASGWHLQKILVQNVDSEKGWLFIGDQWFDKNEGDKQIERDLYPHDDSKPINKPSALLRKPKTPTVAPRSSNDSIDKIDSARKSSKPATPRYTLYRVFVFTSNIRNAGTEANVFIQIFGDSIDTGKLEDDFESSKLTNIRQSFYLRQIAL